MCDPITIAGLALGAASTAANYEANASATHARDDVLAAERIRQQQYDQQAKALNTRSQDSYKDFSGQQQERAQSLGNYFATPLTAGDPNAAAGSIMPSSSSDIVNAESSKQNAKADAYVGQQGQALADYRSFGDLLGDTSRLQARDATLVGQIGGFKQGSSSIVPYELDQASHAGDTMKLFGDLLGGASGIVGGGGLSGLFGGAPAAGAIANAATGPGMGAAATLGSSPWSMALSPAAASAASLYTKHPWLI